MNTLRTESGKLKIFLIIKKSLATTNYIQIFVLNINGDATQSKYFFFSAVKPSSAEQKLSAEESAGKQMW